jgi:hypothetical protein
MMERRFKMELAREEMYTLLSTFDFVNDMGGLTSAELEIKEKIERWFENDRLRSND